MFEFLYAGPNQHTFMTSDQGLQKLEQQQGIIQGPELSMLFFSLYTRHPMCKHLDTINNHGLKYADDIYIYGSIDQASSAWRLLEAECSAIGLAFNPANSELYLPAASATELGHIEHLWHGAKITSHGITCSGAPAGNLEEPA